MKTPTLEEVKEYFKNAKEVKCLWDGKIYNISSWKLYKDECGFRYAENKKAENEGFCGVFGIGEYKKFAEIISYKDTYTVSKDFILEAHESACSTWKTKIENQFPELFSKVKLELNKWYRFKSGTLGYFQGFGKASYGFHFDVWDYFEDHRWFCNKEEMHKIDRLATKEEVETALIAEAKKRGLDKQGIRIECLETLKVELSHNNNFACFNYNNNGIYYNGIKVYKNGKWAEIVSEPIELSLEQRLERIEKHLNIN
jgi:hypothetical protein